MIYCYLHIEGNIASCQKEVAIEGSKHFPFCGEDCHNIYIGTTNPKSSINPNRAKEAEASLIAKGYIRLPFGSYHVWLEPEWFERYKGVLVFKHKRWIPARNKLSDLKLLDEGYSEFKRKQAGASYHAKKEDEEIESLVQSEMKI